MFGYNIRFSGTPHRAADEFGGVDVDGRRRVRCRTREEWLRLDALHICRQNEGVTTHSPANLWDCK